MAPQAPIPNPILEPLDTGSLPKPFKNPHWKPPARRNKTLKQILSDASKALVLSTLPPTTTSTDEAAPAPTTGTSTPTTILPKPPTKKAEKDALALAISQAQSTLGATYTNIESPPSLHPARAHWCDITGLPARYTDPKTKLRYADREVYKAIVGLPAGNAERYLELRGANVVLK